MCKQRVERNEEYTASDFFYSAIVVLVERGLLHGRITRNYKKTQGNGDLATRNLDWAENGKKLALRIGLCCACKKKSAAQMKHLKELLACTGVHSVEEDNLMLPHRVCTGAQSICNTFTNLWLLMSQTFNFRYPSLDHWWRPWTCAHAGLRVHALVVVENPTASLERQCYMQVCALTWFWFKNHCFAKIYAFAIATFNHKHVYHQATACIGIHSLDSSGDLLHGEDTRLASSYCCGIKL